MRRVCSVLAFAALVVCGCRGTNPFGRLPVCPPNRYGGTLTPIGSAGSTPSRLTIDPLALAFNPGLNPDNPQSGDTIYNPSPYERWLYAECRGQIWIDDGHREFKADLDGDGHDERISCDLLKMEAKDWTSARGPRGRPFLCVFSRATDGTWLRRATFCWDDNGGRIRDVELVKGEEYVLLEVHLTSHGATAMGKYCFIIVPGDLARASKVRFMNGFLDEKSDVTTCGSSGYGLEFRQSEDRQTIRFRKYETQPVRVLVRAEYRLEQGVGKSLYGFVLMKEERIPLEQMNSEKW